MHIKLCTLATTGSFFAAILVAAVAPSVSAEETITQEELVRRTQELFNAVVPGNQVPWKNISPMTASISTRKGAT